MQLDFLTAQAELGRFLSSRLLGQVQGALLEKRAQRLADQWWEVLANQRREVIMGTSGIRIIGCTVAFDIGIVKIRNWKTEFMYDTFHIEKLVPVSIALGYFNGFQLYISRKNPTPGAVLVARSEAHTMRWSILDGASPYAGTPLFMALGRAKSLGYFDLLKGTDDES
jgi:hypothetical protein